MQMSVSDQLYVSGNIMIKFICDDGTEIEGIEYINDVYIVPKVIDINNFKDNISDLTITDVDNHISRKMTRAVIFAWYEDGEKYHITLRNATKEEVRIADLESRVAMLEMMLDNDSDDVTDTSDEASVAEKQDQGDQND